MHKKFLSLILIGCCFILTACSQNVTLEREPSSIENNMENNAQSDYEVVAGAFFQSDTSAENTDKNTYEATEKETVSSSIAIEKNDTENEKGKILHKETEDGNVVIIYDNQNHIIETIPVIEKTSVSQLTDNLYEVAQSFGSPARYVFFYDIQTCQLSDVFFNPILIENKYIAYIENDELIIRDIFDEAVFCEKIVKDFTKTADPTSAIISITVDEGKQFTIEYYEGEDYKVVTEIFDGTDTKKESKYHYFVERCWHMGKECRIYGIDGVDVHDYFVPVLQIEIPDNKEKEKRINKMLLERYVAVLPDDTDERWWEQQEIHITYRSERYLCFRYLSNTELPKECNARDLYFTLDLEKERIIEYPLVEGQTGKFEPDEPGNLYKELETYQEKTVEEQSALRGDGTYQVREVTTECNGISFPCVEIEGLEDQEKQKQINAALQEPLRVLIEDGIWEDKKNQQAIFDSTKIYIAYQTEQWLSVVYSMQIPLDPDPRWRDGVRDFGITINIQDGKRVLLEDLFDKNKLLDWFYVMGMYEEGNQLYSGEQYEGLGVLFQTEKEKITEYQYHLQKNDIVEWDEMSWLLGMTDWDSFYLYQGKLVILRIDSYYDYEIPLPELYEYLKVDPWYD